VGTGDVARFEMFGVRCHESQRKSCVKLPALNTVLVTSHVSKSKMLLLRKTIQLRFTLKI
jgi:hypothetical protein